MLLMKTGKMSIIIIPAVNENEEMTPQFWIYQTKSHQHDLKKRIQNIVMIIGNDLVSHQQNIRDAKIIYLYLPS